MPYLLPPLVLLLIPLAVCIASRRAMFIMFARRRPTVAEARTLILPGVCADLIFPLAPLACLYAVFAAFPGLPAVRYFCLALAVLATLAALGVILTNVVDAYVYSNTRRRFFALIFSELRPANIRTAASGRQKLLLLGLLFFSCAYPCGLAFLFAGWGGAGNAAAASAAPAAVTAAFLGAFLAACGLTVLVSGRRKVDPSLYIDSHGIGRHEEIQGQAAGRLEALRVSGLANFFRCLLETLRSRDREPAVIQKYTAEEAAFLCGLGLIEREQFAGGGEAGSRGLAGAVQVHGTPGGGTPGGSGEDCPFRRVILVCLESLSHKMLPLYNRQVPPEVTPFLGSLLEGYPRLDRMQTANSPTNQGLYALQASRLAYDYDFEHGLGRFDTLASLLRERGFASHALSGVTRHYGNKDVLFKRLLRYDDFSGEEELKELNPQATPCGWGLADSAVYTAALLLLERHRDGKILLNITTADTHAGYYHTLPEDVFPESVRTGNSRLFRSLFEADLNLMFFFRALSKARLFDANTLIVITADHSPNHGNEYMRLNNLESFFPDMIPMVFVTPAQSKNPFAALRRDITCSQLDILPTLIDALRLRRPGHLLGRSLFLGLDNMMISRYGSEIRFRAGERDYFAHLGRRGADHEPAEATNRESDTVDIFAASALGKWYGNTLLEPYV